MKVNKLKILLVYIAIAVNLLSATNICAETITQRDAKKIASLFFNALKGEKTETPKFIYTGRDLTTDRLFIPFYIYNHPQGGFVIISADNKTFPILGYSDTETFNYKNISPDLKNLLILYCRHIENIRYDSQIPYDAIDAWTDIRQYIADIILSKSIIADRQICCSLSNIDDCNLSHSDIYTPMQWSELISNQLLQNRSVVIGISTDSGKSDLIVFGQKKDFFAIELPDFGHSCFFRLMPSEIINFGQVAFLGNTICELSDKLDYSEDIPFSFWDDIQNSIDNDVRQSEIKSIEISQQPNVCRMGSGRYMITLPQQAIVAKVFNLNGFTIDMATYNETNSAFIDISHQNNGFYIAVVSDISGNIYSFKLFR